MAFKKKLQIFNGHGRKSMSIKTITSIYAYENHVFDRITMMPLSLNEKAAEDVMTINHISSYSIPSIKTAPFRVVILPDGGEMIVPRHALTIKKASKCDYVLYVGE